MSRHQRAAPRRAPVERRAGTAPRARQIESFLFPIVLMAAPIQRSATGAWSGDLRSGTGRIDAPSGVLADTPFTFATRFEGAPGTNPEELIAAAHAACFSMAFANYLTQQGHTPERIETRATITLDAGTITAMHLETRGRVAGLDDDAFARLAGEAEQKCPVSNLLRSGLTISLAAALDG